MKYEFDIKKFSYKLSNFRMVKKNVSVREAQKQSGVTSSTISRCERGIYFPDMATFGKLCSWMNKNPRSFFTSKKHKK